ncbi:MAG: DegT/DnrJ/EryC1/StrS aminotransferase family protein [Planctomycetota bacterium]
MIKHSYPTIGNKETQAVNAVLKTKHLAQGDAVRRFEEATARYLGGKGLKAAAANSGTSALHLALLALGISAGDEVIIPSYACSAVLNAVNYTGARPLLADINETDFNLSIESTRKKITSRTRAIILVHQFGFPAETDKFLSLKIPIIEDCAQSIGAKYHNKLVGTFGMLAIFSFYATKMLCTGYGGMVVSKDRKLINKVRDLIDYDNRDDYITRYNYQMSDLSAALGLAQLRQLDRFIQRRREIAARYTKALGSLEIPSLILPTVFRSPVLRHSRDSERRMANGTKDTFFRYVIRHPKADRIIPSLNRAGIEAKKPVYKPLHRYLGLNPNQFPNAEQAHRTAISLPIYPSFTGRQINYITDNLAKTLKSI